MLASFGHLAPEPDFDRFLFDFVSIFGSIFDRFSIDSGSNLDRLLYDSLSFLFFELRTLSLVAVPTSWPPVLGPLHRRGHRPF